MKLKIILIIIVAFALAFYVWDSQKASTNAVAAHGSFLGSPPVASKPYNVLDYTKPPPKH